MILLQKWAQQLLIWLKILKTITQLSLWTKGMSLEKLPPSSIYPSIDYFYNEYYLLGIFLSALDKAVNKQGYNHTVNQLQLL